MTFKKATKFAAKGRIAIAGPSGTGKTFTGLTLAFGLADTGKVAVIDTERGSASKYADAFPSFDVMELESYHPDKFIQGIKDAEEGGYEVLLIDSLSHAWNGQGGLLEIVEAITKRSKSGNSFTAWGEATPIQNRLIDAITRSKLHIICTMRSKQEYSLERDERTGKSTPRKVGMAPVQRADLEYEFDCFFEMDYDNTLLVQKSRCSALAGKAIAKPDVQVADILKEWLSGVPAPVEQPLAPSLIDKARSEWARAYKIADNEIDTRWGKFKAYILGVPIADPDLKQSHLDKLNESIQGQLNKVA